MLFDDVEFRVVGVYGEHVDIDGQSGRGGEDFDEDGGERRRRDFDTVGDGVGECRTRWVESSRRDVRVSRVGR